ncbi:phage recombination protein Bet [Rathayibacter sp. Leaf248]|uniref:phage recombination protein Bet n=1 Tax=Rathayibacter sp. Leaf248 TaxID=2876555 RepID=UPI001E52D35E|nr:phage recombination protein Bet [Rathayibacter sp. Leaf248]
MTTDMVRAGAGVLALPTSGDSASWTEQEKALVDAAGLVSRKRNQPPQLAPRAVVEAFLLQCQRTQLDPFARQIYCIERGGKWQTQISIDGARLVAERSGKYEGQTSPEFSNDGQSWSAAWMPTTDRPYPAFARVGVYKAGFREALSVVARWESYAPMEDVWERGAKTGEKRVGAMWQKMPDLMLAKVAEMLALRKAFPNDLSGLYSGEEMAQATNAAPATTSAPVNGAQTRQQERQAPEPQGRADEPQDATVVADDSWQQRAIECTSMAQLRPLYEEAEQAGVFGDVLESGETVRDMLWARKRALETAPPAPSQAEAQPQLPMPWTDMMGGATDMADLLDLRAACERRNEWDDAVAEAFARRTEQLEAALADEEQQS